MKLEITQKELSKHYSEGKTAVMNYKTIYNIRYSHGVQEFILSPVKKTLSNLTLRGRYHIVTPEYLHEILGMDVEKRESDLFT